jgi:hypothetical protein
VRVAIFLISVYEERVAKILERRELIIGGRILNLANVRALAGLIEGESESFPPDKTHSPSILFTAQCGDGSSFESNDADLFLDDSIVARKRVYSVSMRLSYYPTESRISISIQHAERSTRWSRNYATVEGTDSKWVNGNIKAIEEIIESFAPQYPFVLRHKWLVQSVLALGIGRAYDFLIDFIPPRPGPPPHWVAGLHLYLHAHPLVYYGVPYLFYYAGGYFPALFFYEKLLSLWPSVELQIGPEHSNRETATALALQFSCRRGSPARHIFDL